MNNEAASKTPILLVLFIIMIIIIIQWPPIFLLWFLSSCPLMYQCWDQEYNTRLKNKKSLKCFSYEIWIAVEILTTERYPLVVDKQGYNYKKYKLLEEINHSGNHT
jgi:hypothetical protein